MRLIPCGRDLRELDSARLLRGVIASFAIGLTALLPPSRVEALELEVVTETARRPVVAERPARRAADATQTVAGAAGRAGEPVVQEQEELLLAAPPAVAQVVVQPGQRVRIEEISNQQRSTVVTLFPDETDGDADLQPGDDAAIIRMLSLPKRAWGPEQVIGEPDTPGTGDIQTAWASQTTDTQTEWLQVEYAEPVVAKELHIYETYNPGALFKVSVFDKEGKEVTVWQGADPSQPGSGRGVSGVSIDVPFPVQRAKIYLDSTLVPGYNEIDAVGLKDAEGNMHWATNVKASSTYAPSVITLPVNFRASDIIRLRALEKEVKHLRQQAERLRQLEREMQELKKILREKSADKPDR